MRLNVAGILVLSLVSTSNARTDVLKPSVAGSQQQLRHTAASKASSPVSQVQASKTLESSNIQALDKQLGEANEQVKLKVKELKVQADVEKEKELAASQAQKEVSELHQRADKLQKEAEVAAEFAKEKAEASAKAKHDMDIAGSKAGSFLAQEVEMQKVFNRTKREEAMLEQHVTMLQHERAKAISAQHITQLSNTSLGSNASHRSTAWHASNTSNTTNASQATKTLQVFAPGHGKANDTISLSQAMQKLVEENRRLKQEKEELQQQLTAKKVAQEKSKLRQKLKNRLALADRHQKPTTRQH